MSTAPRIDRDEEEAEEPREDLRERLKKLTPSRETLEGEIEFLEARHLQGQELTDEEKRQVKIYLEKEWHIVRLMKLLQTYFKDDIQFGGGSVINYLILRNLDSPPRFTFDVDSSWNRKQYARKYQLLDRLLRFNKWLGEVGEKLYMPITRDASLELYAIKYDPGRDKAPDDRTWMFLLPLRYPVIVRWWGSRFYEYARKAVGVKEMDYSILTRLRGDFNEVLGYKDAGIEDILLELSFVSPGSPDQPRPYKRIHATLPFGMGTMEFNITEIEYQLATKILGRLGEDHGDNPDDNKIYDMLKAVLDLRLLRYPNIADINKAASYVEQISGKPLSEFQDIIRKNLRILEERGMKFWDQGPQILVRKRENFRDLVQETKHKLL